MPPLILPPGAIDIDVLRTTDLTQSINVVTTNTYLTAQSYRINGATNPVPSVPEAGSTLLLFTTCLAGMGWLFGRTARLHR